MLLECNFVRRRYKVSGILSRRTCSHQASVTRTAALPINAFTLPFVRRSTAKAILIACTERQIRIPVPTLLLLLFSLKGILNALIAAVERKLANGRDIARVTSLKRTYNAQTEKKTDKER